MFVQAQFPDELSSVPEAASALDVDVEFEECSMDRSGGDHPVGRTKRRSSSCSVGLRNFQKLQVLGQGDLANVYLVRSQSMPEESKNGQHFAMKVVNKADLVRRNKIGRMWTERDILCSTSHPFIVTLHYCFQTKKYLYLVMQYCAGGELFAQMQLQPNHRLGEDEARFYAAEIVLALEYLHVVGCIYRDLKPENLLLHHSGHVMLADFDLSKRQGQAGVTLSRRGNAKGKWSAIDSPHNSPQRRGRGGGNVPPIELGISALDYPIPYRDASAMEDTPTSSSRRRAGRTGGLCRCISRWLCAPSRLSDYPVIDTETHLDRRRDGSSKRTMSFVGTVEYIAPEVINGAGYAGTVDWWTLGILLYEMLFARTPFKGEDQLDTFNIILDEDKEEENQLTFPADIPVSNACEELIRDLLNRDLQGRLRSPPEIKDHQFFKDVNWALLRHQTPPIVPDLQGGTDTTYFSRFQADELYTSDDELYDMVPHSVLKGGDSSTTTTENSDDNSGDEFAVVPDKKQEWQQKDPNDLGIRELDFDCGNDVEILRGKSDLFVGFDCDRGSNDPHWERV